MKICYFYELSFGGGGDECIFRIFRLLVNFFSPGPASLMSCPYASPFLFDRCTDWGESWEDVMAFCREEGSYIQYYHFASPSLLFYKTLPESYGANDSRVVDNEAVLCYLSHSDLKLINSLEDRRVCGKLMVSAFCSGCGS